MKKKRSPVRVLSKEEQAAIDEAVRAGRITFPAEFLDEDSESIPNEQLN
jgi:hypothetical protein